MPYALQKIHKEALSLKDLILRQVFSFITDNFNFNHFKAIFLFKT